MTTAVAPAPPPPPEPRSYRLTADRVELIEGLLVEKRTENDPHISATLMIREAPGSAWPAGRLLAQDIPVRLARSEPEPNFMVMRGRPTDDLGRKPTPPDVALRIEVSDSRRADDRPRAPLFAEAGIPTYGIANIPDRRIEVDTDPAGTAYRSRTDYGPDAEVPVVLDRQAVARLAVRDLLPPSGPA